RRAASRGGFAACRFGYRFGNHQVLLGAMAGAGVDAYFVTPCRRARKCPYAMIIGTPLCKHRLVFVADNEEGVDSRMIVSKIGLDANKLARQFARQADRMSLGRLGCDDKRDERQPGNSSPREGLQARPSFLRAS